MSEFENIPEVPPQNLPNQSDPYTYYAGQRAVPADTVMFPSQKRIRRNCLGV